MIGIGRFCERPNLQPNYQVGLDGSNYFRTDLIFSCYNTVQDCCVAPYDYVGHGRGTVSGTRQSSGRASIYGDAVQWNGSYLPGANPGGNYYGGGILNGAQFDGTNSTSFVPLDLSPYTYITMAFWARRVSNEIGKISVEYTATIASNNGFYFSINASDGVNTGPSWGGSWNSGATQGTITGNGTNSVVVGTWHHFVMVIDRSSTSWGGNGSTKGTSVNGLQGNFQGAGTSGTGAFSANGGLYFGARGGASIFSNCSIAGFHIWNRLFTYKEAARLYSGGHWQMFTSSTLRRTYFLPVTAPSGTNRWFLTG